MPFGLNLIFGKVDAKLKTPREREGRFNGDGYGQGDCKQPEQKSAELPISNRSFNRLLYASMYLWENVLLIRLARRA